MYKSTKRFVLFHLHAFVIARSIEVSNIVHEHYHLVVSFFIQGLRVFVVVEHDDLKGISYSRLL